MRVSSTMHGDSWHSENRQSYLVETGSNVTLPCTAKGPTKPYEINWFVNLSYLANCTNRTQSPVKTCKLTLRWPDVRGKYACQVHSGSEGCTYKELELKVAGESRLTQVSNYYYCYYYYYHYYYYYYYYYYIIIIKGRC